MFLKQSTATTVVIGPIVNEDGKTLATSATIAAADIKLVKDGGSFSAKNSTTAPVHLGNGFYSVVLNATDTNTPGVFIISVKVTGCLVAWQQYTVYPANIYNALIAGSVADGVGIPADLRGIKGAAVDNGTATLKLKQLYLTGDGTTYALKVDGCSRFENSSSLAAPAFYVKNTLSSIPAFLIEGNSGKGLAVNSTGAEAATFTSTFDSATSSSVLIEKTSAKGIGFYVKGGSGGSAIEAIGGSGTGASAPYGGDAMKLIAGSSSAGYTNISHAIYAKAVETSAVLCEGSGTGGVGLKASGNFAGIHAIANMTGVYAEATDTGLFGAAGIAAHSASSTGNGFAASGHIGIKSNGAYSAMLDGTVGITSEDSTAVNIWTRGLEKSAVKIQSDTGAALELITTAAPETGSGDVAVVKITGLEHPGIVVKSDGEALFLDSISNAGFYAVSRSGAGAIFESLLNGAGIDVIGNGTGSGIRSRKGATGYADFDADSIAAKVSAIYAKLPTVGLIASQNDVLAIRNNTTFVTTIPDSGTIPTTGTRAVRIRCYVYDSEGNMEATDNGLGLMIKDAAGSSKNGKIYKDAALTTLAVAHPNYSGSMKVEPVSGLTGVFELYYRLDSTDSPTILSSDFIYTENAIDKYFGRQTNLYSETPGAATLADSATNREVIAKSFRNYVPVAGLVAGSIESNIETSVAAVQTTVNSISTSVALIKTTGEDTNADIAVLDAWIRTQFAAVAKTTELNSAVNIINSNVDAECAAILSAVQANAVEIAKIVAKLPSTGNISNIQLSTSTSDGTTLEDAIEIVAAGLRGRFKKDGNVVTFYKADGATECFKVSITTTERFPLS